MRALSRRLFLAGGLLAAAGAGTAAGVLTTGRPKPMAALPGPTAAPPVDPPLIIAAVRRELVLIDELDAAAASAPKLAARADILGRDHRAHAAALQSLLAARVAAGTGPPPTGSAAATTSPASGPTTTPATTPATGPATSKDLRTWEKAAAAAAVRDCLDADHLPPAAAGLMASIAACEATHVAWLA